ncbi:MAG TPA: hypothetical protein VMU07_02360 [Candidatus Paceibacterota bacterium]|nr:hypothetical protein [Candidatus Paceibacterota bacterium]
MRNALLSLGQWRLPLMAIAVCFTVVEWSSPFSVSVGISKATAIIMTVVFGTIAILCFEVWFFKESCGKPRDEILMMMPWWEQYPATVKRFLKLLVPERPSSKPNLAIAAVICVAILILACLPLVGWYSVAVAEVFFFPRWLRVPVIVLGNALKDCGFSVFLFGHFAHVSLIYTLIVAAILATIHLIRWSLHAKKPHLGT